MKHDSHPVTDASALAQASQRILVVDDNCDAAEILAKLLALSGHITQTAHDGREALSKAEAWGPEVILLDIGLPFISGLEVARRLRLQTAGQHMVLVALTGRSQSADLQATAAAGFDLHLVKPCNPDQLLNLLPELRARRAAAVPRH